MQKSCMFRITAWFNKPYAGLFCSGNKNPIKTYTLPLIPVVSCEFDFTNNFFDKKNSRFAIFIEKSATFAVTIFV